jgi:hypothetical protein
MIARIGAGSRGHRQSTLNGDRMRQQLMDWARTGDLQQAFPLLVIQLAVQHDRAADSGPLVVLLDIKRNIDIG